MKVNFSHDSKEFIFKLKSHISKDNPSRAKSYTTKLVSRIRDMLQHTYIGKVQATIDNKNIREIILDGMKIIYMIYQNSVDIVII